MGYKHAKLYFLITLILIFVADLFAVYFIYPYSGDYKEYFIHFSGNHGERFELGYRALVYSFNMISGGSESAFLFFLFSVSFITLFIKSFVLYRMNPKSLIIFIVLYLLYLFLLHEANQIRISIGLAFGILSIYFLSRKKIYHSVWMLMIGCLFHLSLVIFAISYAAYYAEVTKKKLLLYIGFGVGAVLIYIIFDPLILIKVNPLIEKYITFNLEYSFNGFYLFLLFQLGFIGGLSYKHASQFGKLVFHTYVMVFVLALSFSAIPIISVRIMDIASFLAFYYVLSFQFTFKPRVFVLYLTIMSIVIPRFLVFMYTNTIYNFSN